MTIQIKYLALLAGIMLALGYGAGRYLQPPEVKTVVQIKKEIEVQEHIHTVTKIVEHKDGTKETIVDEDKDKNTQSDTTKDKDITVISKKTTNFSVLLGVEPNLTGGLSIGPVNAGASYITQPVSFLPVTIGVWGLVLPSPTVGVSLGWSY